VQVNADPPLVTVHVPALRHGLGEHGLTAADVVVAITPITTRAKMMLPRFISFRVLRDFV